MRFASPLATVVSVVLVLTGLGAMAVVGRAAGVAARAHARLLDLRVDATDHAGWWWPVAGVAGRVARRAQQARSRRQLARALPELLERTAWEVSAGAVVSDALATAGRRAPAPVARELAGVFDQVALGVPLSGALQAWAARARSSEVRHVVAGLCLALEAGGQQAAALENLASSLRERHSVTEEARVLATQARASAVVIAAAPVVFGTLLGMGDSRAVAFLFGSPGGLACLAAGLALDGAGAWWMWRITRSVG